MALAETLVSRREEKTRELQPQAVNQPSRQAAAPTACLHWKQVRRFKCSRAVWALNTEEPQEASSMSSPNRALIVSTARSFTSLVMTLSTLVIGSPTVEGSASRRGA